MTSYPAGGIVPHYTQGTKFLLIGIFQMVMKMKCMELY